MEQEKLKYSDITQKIIGCAMKVHQKMRNGYTEQIYQRCLAIELSRMNISFRQEVELSIYYEHIQIGKRRVDFLIDDKIVVEIKALSELTDQHLAQALNYLETQRLEVGLLINFGAKSLQFKRLTNQQKLQQESDKNPVNPINNPINPRS
jgi:GxxExxY protein